MLTDRLAYFGSKIMYLQGICTLPIAARETRMELQNAEQLSIPLPSEMARLIREALRSWLERDRRLSAVNSVIVRGVADAKANRVHAIQDVRDEMRARLAAKD